MSTAAETRERLVAKLDELYRFAKELSLDPEYGDEDDPPIWAIARQVVERNHPEPGESAKAYCARLHGIARAALAGHTRPCASEALGLIRAAADGGGQTG